MPEDACSESTPLLAAIAGIDADDTGAETLTRYSWQAKHALRHWLTCLSTDGPDLVICEHVEDLTVVHTDRVRFLQLKTRDRGSWTPFDMCDKGIKSLARSYRHAREAGVHTHATFELLLEGPIGDNPETVAFVKNPTTAIPTVRKKIIGHCGLDAAHLEDFLGRLRIRPDQTPRAAIDAVLTKNMLTLWPNLTGYEAEEIIARLLAPVAKAQESDRSDEITRAIVGILAPGSTRSAPGSIASKTLTGAMIRELTPPIHETIGERLLAHMAAERHISMLELKLGLAGTSTVHVQEIQKWRAMAEVRMRECGLDDTAVSTALEAVDTRVLSLARVTVAELAHTSGRHPGSAVVSRLFGQMGALAQCDQTGLLSHDGFLVLGRLAQISDACRFDWRSV